MDDHADWPTVDLLSIRADRTPGTVGVVDAETESEYTYREFDAIVDGLAARLADALPPLDVDRAPRVGLCTAPGLAHATAFYAVQRVGAVGVGLDADLVPSGLAAQLDRAGVDLLVCASETEERAAEAADCPVYSLDAPSESGVGRLQLVDPGGERDSGDVAAFEPRRRDPDETALILFTSGTGGDPKGVRLTPSNLASSAMGSAYRLGVTADDRWLACLPVSHMGGIAPLVRCVLYGTGLVVQSGFDRERTQAVIDRHDATAVSLVPTMLKRLLDAGWEPADRFRTVLLGGAPATESLLDRALDAGVPVHPTYGLTETASQVATARPSEVREAPDSVGPPLLPTTVTILDTDGEPAPRGEAGEIVVGGPTVTPGYLSDERTAESFGEYGFHTGDLGYRDEAGRLHVEGRVDDLIVTGGENVRPQAVVEALEAEGDVAAAAVLGVPDEEWGERVCALVVPTDGDGITTETIREAARERLPRYAVPKTVRFVEELPRTASGTIDREAARALL